MRIVIIGTLTCVLLCGCGQAKLQEQIADLQKQVWELKEQNGKLAVKVEALEGQQVEHVERRRRLHGRTGDVDSSGELGPLL